VVCASAMMPVFPVALPRSVTISALMPSSFTRLTRSDVLPAVHFRPAPGVAMVGRIGTHAPETAPFRPTTKRVSGLGGDKSFSGDFPSARLPVLARP
jgi:hypothetical protein